MSRKAQGRFVSGCDITITPPRVGALGIGSKSRSSLAMPGDLASVSRRRPGFKHQRANVAHQGLGGLGRGVLTAQVPDSLGARAGSGPALCGARTPPTASVDHEPTVTGPTDVAAVRFRNQRERSPAAITRCGQTPDLSCSVEAVELVIADGVRALHREHHKGLSQVNAPPGRWHSLAIGRSRRKQMLAISRAVAVLASVVTWIAGTFLLVTVYKAILGAPFEEAIDADFGVASGTTRLMLLFLYLAFWLSFLIAELRGADLLGAIRAFFRWASGSRSK